MEDGEKLIEFLGEGSRVFPRPFPARQGAPDWLKDIPPERATAEGRTVGTVKKCPPFVDALTAGYFIPLVADVTFRMGNDGILDFSAELPIVGTHNPEQVRGTPLEGRPLVKFSNPWIVRTPAGYSCLFTHPINRFDLPFHILSGVIETDRHYLEANFPAICLLAPGQTVTLKRGTPIMQVIPFKRDTWKSSVAHTDAEHHGQIEQEFGEDRARYRNHYWVRKDYQ
jgi:hypothetical protein